MSLIAALALALALAGLATLVVVVTACRAGAQQDRAQEEQMADLEAAIARHPAGKKL